jgi:hypothetical protein
MSMMVIGTSLLYYDKVGRVCCMMFIDSFNDDVEQVTGTVGGLETETCKHCTGDSPFKDTVLLIVSSNRVVS